MEEEKKAIEYLEKLYPLEWWRLPDNQGRLKVDVKLSNAKEIVLNLIEKQQAEIEKKDKIIDLLSEQLAGLTIWDIERDEPLILGDKEEVKQYFENQVAVK